MAPLPVPPPSGPAGTLTSETSAPDNASRFDDPRGASIVYEGRMAHHVDSSARRGAAGLGRAEDANRAIRDVNQALFDSIGSPARMAYGQVGPVESEAMLDELARFVRVLGKSGVTDLSIADVPALYKRREGIRRLGRCTTATDLGQCSTADVARGFGVSVAEAKRIRLELLTAVLERLDPDSIRPDAPLVNPVRERLESRYDAGRLKELERSAGVVERSPRERGGAGYGRMTDYTG